MGSIGQTPRVQQILGKWGIEAPTEVLYEETKEKFVEFVLKEAAKAGTKQVVKKFIPIYNLIDFGRQAVSIPGTVKEATEMIKIYSKYLDEEMEKTKKILPDPVNPKFG